MKLGAEAHGYVMRLLEQPSMRAWYASALAETQRDEPHEQLARRVGTWHEDRRAPPVPPVLPR